MNRRVPLYKAGLQETTYGEAATVLRPVGNWHFLHALDVIAANDLYRLIPTDERDCDDAIFITGWSPIHNDSKLIGKPYHEVDSQLEIIRPVDGQGTSYPVYELMDKEDEKGHEQD